MALFGLPFLSIRGRYVADTHDILWFAPSWYLRHSLSLWQPDVFLRGQANLGIPAVIVWLLRTAGLSVWIAQRIWYGLLLFTGATGTILLVRQLRGRRSIIGPLAAGLLFVLTPYTFGYGFLFSTVFVPYVLLPWLLLIAAKGMADSSIMWPALFGLSVFAMGGANGAPQVYAMLPVAAYVLWVWAVERSVPGRRVLAWAGLALAFVLALNAYWILGARSEQVANSVVYSEQPAVINQSSSYAETIRDLGFWQYYGGAGANPWIPTVRRYVADPLFVVLSFGLPVAALISAWLLRRWRMRFLFLFLATAGVVGMAGIFPTDSPTPFGRTLLFLYDHVLAIAGLRTTYKLGATLNISLAILAGVGLEEGWVRLRPRSGWSLAGRPLIAAAAVTIIGASSFPLWAGRFEPPRSSGPIPDYWRSALQYLEHDGNRHNQFFAPGALLPAYRWGALMENVAETSPSIRSLFAWPFPVGERYGTNMLAAAEQPYQTGIGSSGEAVILRYLGVRYVVLQNDVDWAGTGTARPADLQVLVRDPSLMPVATFGRPGENTTGKASSPRDASVAQFERTLPPVQVLAVRNPLPAVRAEVGQPFVVDGDAFGVAAIAREGLLDGNPPLLYSGDLTARELARLAKDHPVFVVTDSNRRAVHSFNAVRDNTSYTLAPGETIGGYPVGWNLFGDRGDTQTTALVVGVRSVTASGYGSAFAAQPRFRPANAFDGDPSTPWLVGGYGRHPRGWIQVRFEKSLELGHVGLLVPSTFGRQVRTARLEFSDGSSIVSRVSPGQNDVRFPPRATAFLRVRIEDATTGFLNAVGFNEISIPGVRVREVVRVPTDLFETGRRSPTAAAVIHSSSLVYAFGRALRESPTGLDQETLIARQFEVPGSRDFSLSGTAHLDLAARDQDIDLLAGSAGDVEASSSSRLSGDPDFRASSALDGNPATSWVSSGTTGEWLRVRFPTRTVNHISIRPATGFGRSRLERVQVSFSNGEPMVASVDEKSGSFDLHFEDRRTSEIGVRILAVGPATGPRTAGISELAIPGVRITPSDTSAPVHCVGNAVVVDGSPVGVKPAATVSQVLGGAEVGISACDGRPITLADGAHRLFAGGVLQPDSIRLSSLRPVVTPKADPPRITVHGRADGGLDVDVHDAKSPFYLVTGEDWTPDWRATIQGGSLGKPLVLDGFSAGWRIDRAGSYRVAVGFGPQRGYSVVLLISALSLIATLALLPVWLLSRRRS
jgi:arabinofuranan 3-O-arabinosyltransferase